MAVAFDRCIVVGCMELVGVDDRFYCAPHRAAASAPNGCVFCGEPLALGDRIACRDHRRQLDMTAMPWEVGAA